MLFMVALAATISVADHKMYMNVKGACPARENVFVKGSPVKVCGATNTLDETKKTCWKSFGSTKAECFIPACYDGKTPPSNMKECQPSANAVDVNDMGVNVRASALAPTSFRDSFLAAFLTNDVDSNGLRWGWPDIPNSAFLNIPDSLVGRLGQVPNVYIGGGFKITFDCTIAGEGDMCDIFAFIYRCPPCTFSDGGGFVLELLADGWEPYSCDVQFQLDQTVPTHKHDTIVYHKQIPKHGVRETGYTIAPAEVLELAWFATSEATAHCSDYDKDQCASELPDECKWDAEIQECTRILCPPKSQGPDRVHRPGPGGHFTEPKGPWVQKCKVCVDEERDMYMPPMPIS